MDVLIAEDNPNDVALIQRALKRIGAVRSVNVARDGQEVVNYLLGEGKFSDRNLCPIPGLILLDIKMPQMDGLQVLHWIRENPKFRRIPVVILTGSMDKSEKQQAFTTGVNSYLAKSPLIHMTDTLVGVLNYWVTENQSPELPHD